MNLAYVLFFFSLWVSWYVGVHRTEEMPRGFKDVPVLQPESSASGETPALTPVIPEKDRGPASEATESSALSPALEPDAFRTKYGDHLVWTHARSGATVGIQSKTDRLDEWEKNQRVPGFSPRNPAQVIARATEVLRDARDILKLDARYPLGNPRATQTDFSAQVTFEEQHGGIPLSQGQVTVLLGPGGELRAIESDYIHELKIQNRRPAGGAGRTILWVDRRSEESASARYAKEVRESGIQTIRDPHTGQVIYRRNRRMH